MFVLPRFGKFANFVWLEKAERPYHQVIVGSLIVCSFGPLSPRLFKTSVSIANIKSPRTESLVFSRSTVSRFTQFANALCKVTLFETPFGSGLKLLSYAAMKLGFWIATLVNELQFANVPSEINSKLSSADQPFLSSKSVIAVFAKAYLPKILIDFGKFSIVFRFVMFAKIKSGNLSIVIPSSKVTVSILELLNTPPFTVPNNPEPAAPAQA